MRTNYQKREAKEYNWFRGFFQWLTCSTFGIYYKVAFNLKIYGRENVPKKGFFIVASNHVSANDPFMVIHAIKRHTAYIAKIELFEKKIMRFFLDWLGAFAVDREKLSMSTVKTAHALKQTGWPLGIFPQGTREQEGSFENINKGFATFAKTLKCPILPVAISGGSKDVRKPFRSKMIIKIGKPIPYSENIDETVKKWSNTVNNMIKEADNEINPTINYASRKASSFNFLTRAYQLYSLFVVYMPVFWFPFYRMKIDRNKKLDKKKNYIVAPNHISYMDVYVVNHAVGRRMAYMAKQELFNTTTRFRRWVTTNIIRLGAFAVNREKPSISTIKTVKEVFKAKYDLCIFPQGGIRKNKTIENINPGFIYFAKTNKIDILPVGVSGLETYNWNPLKKQKVYLKVGEPISYELDDDEIIAQWAKQICDATGYENCYAKK